MNKPTDEYTSAYDEGYENGWLDGVHVGISQLRAIEADLKNYQKSTKEVREHRASIKDPKYWNNWEHLILDLLDIVKERREKMWTRVLKRVYE